MKIREVVANNRRKTFEVRIRARSYPFPYALLRLRPTPENRVREAFPDEELGMEGFRYRLEDGSEDTVPVDAVLEYNRDPDRLTELLLHKLTLEARAALEEGDLSKREVIRRLGTSASQLYRLLDPAYQAKSVGQMVSLLHLLGRRVDVVVTPRQVG